MNNYILLAITNISENLKKDWDRDFKEIIHKKFPEVVPYASAHQIIDGTVTDICEMIGEFLGEDDTDKFVYLQGDSSVCYYVYMALKDECIRFIFPQYDEDINLIQWRGL